MTFSAAGARIARTRPSVFMIRDSVFEICLFRMAGAGRESTGAVPDLDEMTQGVARLVPACFALMIAFMGRDRLERDGEVPAAGQGERPRPAAAIVRRAARPPA